MARRRKNLTKKLNELVVRVNEHHECLQDLIEHLVETEERDKKSFNTDLAKDMLERGILIGMDLKKKIWDNYGYA